ncbi:conserved hypothetical protein [Perkinsus marinus ATCC 50983]|uniref:Uncharacterized protein n=1 Tax=Perkinsus marinus (strain ATCC 50983 / TXsc) TaxID=423536 RepID=C5L779_PERM5|nr:conserved hypothetical protein [Perkinsus marinus ATCC 50983]EER07341.1 conserved hypothetical protein [Perkinsus marinus ATCC 50983]|eukprot:XP_002775525.1 conserved hypothetical protein [Perkinsus marinus ATCC 50983]
MSVLLISALCGVLIFTPTGGQSTTNPATVGSSTTTSISSTVVTTTGQSTTAPATIGSSTVTPASSTTVTTAVTTPATTTVSEDVVMRTCDVYCRGLNGPESFCKNWLDDAVCQGGNQPCGTLDVCGPAVSTGTTFHPRCDEMCQSLNDVTSYCKWWMDIPVCQGGDQPCGDVSICTAQTWPPASTPPFINGPHQYHSPTCDTYCQGLNDEGSYCKWWAAEPVCQGGNQACTPDVCGVGEATPATTTDTFHMGQNANCDAYCEDINPEMILEKSHCKWWLHIAVCHQGDQVCTPSVCENYTPSP